MSNTIKVRAAAETCDGHGPLKDVHTGAYVPGTSQRFYTCFACRGVLYVARPVAEAPCGASVDVSNDGTTWFDEIGTLWSPRSLAEARLATNVGIAAGKLAGRFVSPSEVTCIVTLALLDPDGDFRLRIRSSLINYLAIDAVDRKDEVDAAMASLIELMEHDRELY